MLRYVPVDIICSEKQTVTMATFEAQIYFTACDSFENWGISPGYSPVLAVAYSVS